MQESGRGKASLPLVHFLIGSTQVRVFSLSSASNAILFCLGSEKSGKRKKRQKMAGKMAGKNGGKKWREKIARF
jgi:hypothetical protein